MWTQDQEDLLIDAYKNKIPIRTIKELDDKNNYSINRKAETIGLADQYPDFDYMVGQMFGYLTVEKKVEPQINPCGTKAMMYQCICECGQHCIVNGGSLRNGSTKSCGCMKKILNGIAHSKMNTYDLNGEYGIGYDNHGNEFYFDKEDYDKIKQYRWSVDETTGYVISTDSTRNYRKIRMHRLIMDVYPGNEQIHIDHIHTERKNDNRKINLRFATRSQNGMNMKQMPSNTSGVTGVSYKKSEGLWTAYITKNGKRIWLGSSKDFSKAVQLRKDAEAKLFGDRSYDNSQAVDIGNIEQE